MKRQTHAGLRVLAQAGQARQRRGTLEARPGLWGRKHAAATLAFNYGVPPFLADPEIRRRLQAAGIAPVCQIPQDDTPHIGCVDASAPGLHNASTDLALRSDSAECGKGNLRKPGMHEKGRTNSS
jgi:hypothetical protein